MKGFSIEDGMFKLVDGEAMVASRLKRLIMSPIDSQIGFINQGSRLMDYFHQKPTQATVLAILNEVKNLIKAYERNINLKSISAKISTPSNYGANELDITLQYTINGISGIAGNLVKTVVISSSSIGGI